MESPAAPKFIIVSIPSFVPIPPAEITGILQCLFKSGIISSGVSFPACPPALQFTAITASAP